MELLRLIVLFIIATLGLILDGFVFKQLWEWFVVKQFNLSPLTLPLAIGLSLMVTHLTYNSNVYKSKEKELVDFEKVAISCFIKPLLILFLGWTIHSCFM